ncbi:MAG: hypothetical protein ACLQQB_09125 [Solirubrobacteraceae bacterium]
MARVLIVGGGARGRRLAIQLVDEGHAVRIVTRTEAGRAVIEAAGAECLIGTPDRLATLRGALGGVTIACWMLATARGTPEQVRALHGSRLEAWLGQAIDTTMRGFVYEAAGVPGGAVPADVLAEGERIVRRIAERNEIPAGFLRADPGEPDLWIEDARAVIDALLLGPIDR